MDGGEDALGEVARDRDLGELEGDRSCMPDDPGAYLDQAGLQARQQPVGDLGQICVSIGLQDAPPSQEVFLDVYAAAITRVVEHRSRWGAAAERSRERDPNVRCATSDALH